MMEEFDKPNILAMFKALSIFADAMREYLGGRLSSVRGRNAEDLIQKSIGEDQFEVFKDNLYRNQGNVGHSLDIGNFPFIISRNWVDIFMGDFRRFRETREIFDTLREARNETMHLPARDLDVEYVENRLDKILDVLRQIKSPEAYERIEMIRDQVLNPLADTAAPAPLQIQPAQHRKSSPTELPMQDSEAAPRLRSNIRTSQRVLATRADSTSTSIPQTQHRAPRSSTIQGRTPLRNLGSGPDNRREPGRQPQRILKKSASARVNSVCANPKCDEINTIFASPVAQHTTVECFRCSTNYEILSFRAVDSSIQRHVQNGVSIDRYRLQTTLADGRNRLMTFDLSDPTGVDLQDVITLSINDSGAASSIYNQNRHLHWKLGQSDPLAETRS